MDEKNPLQVCPVRSPKRKGEVLNKCGRPALEGIIKFGPQPRSIVAQMLSDMKSKNIGEDELSSQKDNSQDFVEVIEVDDDICETCSNRNCSVVEHKSHMPSHQLNFCDYPNCSYSCKLSSNLIKHKRVHTNEKPYLCDRCSFRTNFVNSLKVHKRIHTAEKPYQCEYCSYKCNSSSNLKKHCQLRHPEKSKCKYK